MQENTIPNFNVAPPTVDLTKLSSAGLPPVAAPAGQVKTTSPVSSPTSVVSSGTAAADVNGISGTVNDAQSAIDAQAAKKAADAKAASDAATATAAAKPPVTPPTPEQQIANTPDPGNQFVYDKATGERSEIPVTQALTPNQTMTDVVNAGAQDSVVSGSTTYKQFGDGTYGAYDDSGKYLGPASAMAFAAAKGAQKATSDLESIKNGTYPLTAGQQAQLDEVTNYYKQLIQAQQTENDNITGNTTGIQNLYGVGGTSVGISAINKTIADGALKIADLNKQMVTAVASLRTSLQNDDIGVIKDLYNNYQDTLGAKQKEIDLIRTTAAAAVKAQQTNTASVVDAYAKKYQDTVVPILPTDSIEEMNAKLQTSPSYQQDQKTKQGLVDQNVLDGMIKIYTKTGQIPAGMGTASVALKRAFYAQIGGAPALADQATVDKAALTASTAALKTQETQYTATQTSAGTIKSSMGRLETYIKPLVDSGSPLINKPLRFLSGSVLGSDTYSAFQNEINTVATEYGKIITGASASVAGVSVQSVQDIKNALNDNVNVSQLETVLDAMKQDINARLVTQKGTIDQITNDISQLGTSNTTALDNAGGETLNTTSQSILDKYNIK